MVGLTLPLATVNNIADMTCGYSNLKCDVFAHHSIFGKTANLIDLPWCKLGIPKALVLGVVLFNRIFRVNLGVSHKKMLRTHTGWIVVIWLAVVQNVLAIGNRTFVEHVGSLVSLNSLGSVPGSDTAVAITIFGTIPDPASFSFSHKRMPTFGEVRSVSHIQHELRGNEFRNSVPFDFLNRCPALDAEKFGPLQLLWRERDIRVIHFPESFDVSMHPQCPVIWVSAREQVIRTDVEQFHFLGDGSIMDYPRSTLDGDCWPPAFGSEDFCVTGGVNRPNPLPAAFGADYLLEESLREVNGQSFCGHDGVKTGLTLCTDTVSISLHSINRLIVCHGSGPTRRGATSILPPSPFQSTQIHYGY